MKRKLFTAVCILLASAIAPYGAFAKAKKDAKKDIGIQLYSVRDLIGSFGRNQHDYKPVLKALADMGYTSIEAASYNDGKFYGNTPEEFRRDVEAVGMKVLSSHCGKGLSDEELASGDFSESMKWWDQCIAAHKAAGMEYIVTPYLPVPKTLKEMQTYCDYLNAIGKKCREAGIKYGYHNHAHEFQKIEDKAVMLDYMIENTDPENLFIELDVYWASKGGVNPSAYIQKYAGRFPLLHIKDVDIIGASETIDFESIFKAAYKQGLEEYYVEIEANSLPPMLCARKSAEYLNVSKFVK